MAAKRKKTEVLHLRISVELKAKLIAITDRDNCTQTATLERLINKDSEGLPLNIQLGLGV